jgi:hypothetical protein
LFVEVSEIDHISERHELRERRRERESSRNTSDVGTNSRRQRILCNGTYGESLRELDVSPQSRGECGDFEQGGESAGQRRERVAQGTSTFTAGVLREKSAWLEAGRAKDTGGDRGPWAA